MKILITNFYSQNNNGDTAILASLIFELRRVFENPDLTISTIDKSDFDKTFEGVPYISAFITTSLDIKSGRLSKMVNIFRSWTMTSLWVIIFRLSNQKADWLLKKKESEIMNELANSDLIVAVGGGYIRSYAGLIKIIDLALVLQILCLSRLLGKKIILYSQSIGPFGDQAQEKLATFVLKWMQLIITRESVSRNLLKKMGVKDELIFQSADAAFLIKKYITSNKFISEEILRLKKINIGPLIGVTARNWLNEVAQRKYEHEMAEVLDQIVKKYNARIIFIPQVTVARNQDDDRIVQRRIFESMKQKTKALNMTGIYDYKEVYAMYSQMDFLIGTRFHSVIFALAAGIPALAIAYEHKATGIMKDLELSDWTINIEDVTKDILFFLFNQLYQQKNQYLKILNKNLPIQIEKAEKAADKIREVAFRKKLF